MGNIGNPDGDNIKIHTIGKFASFLFRSARRSLPDALAPFTPPPGSKDGHVIEEGREFGWTNVFDTPSEEDGYIVEFLGGRDVRIWAYVDQGGRAFATDEPIDMPPSNKADLSMAIYEEDDEKSDEGSEKGYIFVLDENGDQREIARYIEKEDGYDVYDSWYQLGEHSKDIAYSDLMTRMYCAAVIRPKITGIEIPSRSIEDLLAMLHGDNFVMGLRDVRQMIKNAEIDPALKAPALVQLFAEWLEEAGFDDKTSRSWLSGYDEEDEGPLRLVRTEQYANTYFILGIDEEFKIPARKIWAIESALNRLLLISESLGDRATIASIEECVECENRIRLGIADQAPLVSDTVNSELNGLQGEWDIRCKIGRDMELLRLPYRFEAQFRADIHGEGLVSFVVMAPDAETMPKRKYVQSTSSWVDTTHAEREGEAIAYSERLGIALAASAFSASRQIRSVVVKASPLPKEDSADMGEAFYFVRFTREQFCESYACAAAAGSDPHPFFESFGVLMGDEAQFADPFEAIKASEAYQIRANAPEIGGSKLSLTLEQQQALGVSGVNDLCIRRDAELLFAADQIATRMHEASSVQEAIRIVREVQDSTENPRVFEGCTRIMTELVSGTLDARDTEMLMKYIGDRDYYEEVLDEARALAEIDPEKAADLLKGAIVYAQASGRFLDTNEVVHRFFDSYVCRVLYNRLKIDGGRRVELIPPSLLACHLQLVELCNEFSQSDSLNEYGLRCLDLAPTFAMAYRHCGRAHMLVGDTDGAAKRLKACLMFSLSEEDIAIAYYQLAYVEWKAGRLLSGQACYYKSIMASQICARQAALELRELMREEGLEAIPPDDVDGVLMKCDIPVAPAPVHLDAIEEAMRAALDAGIYAVAHDLMLTYLRYRPDDALTNVLNSLRKIEAEAVTGE